MVEVVNTCGTRGSRMVNVAIGCSGFGFDFDYLLNVIKIPVTTVLQRVETVDDRGQLIPWTVSVTIS